MGVALEFLGEQKKQLNPNDQLILADLPQLRNFFSYSMRPLYDTAVLPRKVITHLHSPGVPQNDDAACKRHGWTLWKNAIGRPPAKVVDAIIFSVELDLLGGSSVWRCLGNRPR